MDIDVTDKVDFGLNDGEYLPLVECVCGQEFESWSFLLNNDSSYGKKCDNCGREFTNAMKCEKCGFIVCSDCYEIHDTDNCINREDIHA